MRAEQTKQGREKVSKTGPAPEKWDLSHRPTVRTVAAMTQFELPATDTIDLVLRGRVVLRQAAKGYRSSVDALALAWFAARQQSATPRRLVDLGTGTGLVALTLGLHWRDVALVAVELQTLLAARTRWNAAANGMDERLTVLEHDVRSELVCPEPAELVTCNPPYRPDYQHLPPANPERRLAHALLPGVLQGFAQAAAAALTPDGQSCWVFPWDKRALLAEALVAAGLGHQVWTPLQHWSGDQQPVRALVCARLGPAQHAQTAPLWLHERGQLEAVYCPDLEAFLAGLGPSQRTAPYP